MSKYINSVSVKVCDTGVTFANSCYFPGNTSADWTTAKAHCEGQGYHLVTITSAEENQFVTDLVKGLYNTTGEARIILLVPYYY